MDQKPREGRPRERNGPVLEEKIKDGKIPPSESPNTYSSKMGAQSKLKKTRAPDENRPNGVGLGELPDMSVLSHPIIYIFRR